MTSLFHFWLWLTGGIIALSYLLMATSGITYRMRVWALLPITLAVGWPFWVGGQLWRKVSFWLWR